MRCIRPALLAGIALLAGCAQPPSPESSPPASAVAGLWPDAIGASARPSRSWEEYRLRAARRVVLNNEAATFSGTLPDRLRSIPVLQVQLRRDGSVRNIVVLRTPKSSPETVKMAMAAIRRAEPFEPVGNLSQPWQFNETFLYNDQLKFQLRTLAESP